MEYPSVAPLCARCVFWTNPPCIGIASGADRARRRSTRRKSSLGRGRRNKHHYLSRDYRGYVRGSDQLGDGGATCPPGAGPSTECGKCGVHRNEMSRSGHRQSSVVRFSPSEMLSPPDRYEPKTVQSWSRDECSALTMSCRRVCQP